MNNIFIQKGVVNLLVSDDADPNKLFSLIQGALSSWGALNFNAKENKLSFEGGRFIKSNMNPIMGVSSGDLEIYTYRGNYCIRYKLKLKHLFYWGVLAAFMFGIVVATNTETSAFTSILAGIGAGAFGFGFIYFGYYASTIIRFPRFLQRAVSNEKS